MAGNFCQFCGVEMESGSSFCQACGKQKTAVNVQPVSQYVNAAPQSQASSYSYSSLDANNTPLRVGQYIGMFVLMMIPLVRFICLLVWAFSSNVNINKKNFARAVLIVALVCIALSIIFWVVFAAVLLPVIEEFVNSYDFENGFNYDFEYGMY